MATWERTKWADEYELRLIREAARTVLVKHTPRIPPTLIAQYAQWHEERLQNDATATHRATERDYRIARDEESFAD